MRAFAIKSSELPYLRRPPRHGLGVTLKPVPTTPVNVERLESETALLLRIRDVQDVAAFDELFNTLGPKIYGYLVRAGGCTPADGENLLQDIWCNVWTRAGRFDPLLASARTWIFAMARHAMIDLKRAQKREFGALEQYFAENEDAQTVADPHAILADGEKAAALLSHLPTDQSQVLLMAYVEGKSHREIARELALPVGTVKSRLRLGFTRLRALLARTA
jgi:RNA polymerase sigma-70 factor, ECF subfamily